MNNARKLEWFKVFFFGLFIGLFVIIPIFVFSAPNLAQRLQGKILLAVEDHGKTYYVHNDGFRYRITQTTAIRIFERLALGINNENLSKIPEGSVGIDPESKTADECIVAEPTIVNQQCPVGNIFGNDILKCEKEYLISQTNFERAQKISSIYYDALVQCQKVEVE